MKVWLNEFCFPQALTVFNSLFFTLLIICTDPVYLLKALFPEQGMIGLYRELKNGKEKSVQAV
ncbi:hypothetical protein L4D76_09905 [Photobacterium sagamiensis]|uniref:hypothetical protein n=1 Tax=Photobacterium sagamiensis TaxID=2910241 RepID=UPI003D0AE232